MMKGVGEESKGPSPCPYSVDAEAILHWMTSRSSQKVLAVLLKDEGPQTQKHEIAVVSVKLLQFGAEVRD